MKIGTILDQIDLGSIALPKFQRGFVWNRDQVRSLMHSLYRKHPIGSLLVWVTKTETASAKGHAGLSPGFVKLLLDGQQRMTALYGIIRGKAPQFFDGNLRAFTGLYFNLEDERFEFYAPTKMKDKPLWINVTELMNAGVGKFIMRFLGNPELEAELETNTMRLTAIHNIKDIDLHVEEVTGQDKTVDVVVDIFNQVNSGGTKLSKGDLALARICAMWPEAREEMKARLDKWAKKGFNFKLEWLLRCVNTIVTGEALFSALKDVQTETFRKGLNQAEKAADKLLNLVSSRLGLDHDRVVGGRYAFPLMARYLTQRGGHLTDYKERDALLYWYVHSFLWGRYTGSTESVLNQDLAVIEKSEAPTDGLIQQLRQVRGDLQLKPEDFVGWSRGARFYPLLYMLTRVYKAKDWDTGVELSTKFSRLHVHHIFPRSVLYKHEYSKRQVNAIANFTFLTEETNLRVSNRFPEQYLEEFVQKQPGAVESHWIPMDRKLWQIENYLDFLAVRRKLLAKAANDFLETLFAGAIPEREIPPGGIASEEEGQLLRECNEWIVSQGLPLGEIEYQLADPQSAEQLAVLDLAWPNGLQEGYSHPVALLINESSETFDAANRAGYRYFTDIDAFRKYVEREILALEEAGD